MKANFLKRNLLIIESRVKRLIRLPQVADWFMPGNEVLKEAGILLTSGNTRRPDRVILKDGKTIIIDFKFGEENDLIILNRLTCIAVYLPIWVIII